MTQKKIIIPGLDICKDHHTHTTYSDGKATLSESVEAAMDKGLKTIAVTDHMPLFFPNRFAMDPGAVDLYRKDLFEAKKRYDGKIEILAGMEMEFLPEKKGWAESIAEKGWDMLIGSVHMLPRSGRYYLINGKLNEFDDALREGFGGDIKGLVTAYYEKLAETLSTGLFQTVGHLDVIKRHNKNGELFDESRGWYVRLTDEILSIAKKNNMAVEINTKGLYQAGTREQYPNLDILKKCVDMDIPLVLSSDSHSIDSLGRDFSLFSDACRF